MDAIAPVRARVDNPILDHAQPEPTDIFMATNILLEDGVTPMIGEDGRAILTEGPLNGEGI